MIIDIKTRALVQFNNWHFINLPICDYADTPDYACNGTSVDSVLYEDDEDIHQYMNLTTSTLFHFNILIFDKV